MDVNANSEAGGERLNTPVSFNQLPLNEDFETICSGMEKVDLTEEEADALLSEALEINKRLKEELRRQVEREMGMGRSGARTRSGSGKTKTLGLEGVTDKKGNILVSSLPPINPTRGPLANQQGVYSSLETSQQPNGKVTSTAQRKTHSADSGLIQHTTCTSSGHPTRARSMESAEPKQRPEWNDRFSFGN